MILALPRWLASVVAAVAAVGVTDVDVAAVEVSVIISL